MGFGKKKSYNYYDMKYEEYCARLEELSDDAEDCIEELDDLLDEFDEILCNVEGLKNKIEKTGEGSEEDNDKKKRRSGCEEDIILDMDELLETAEEDEKLFPEGEINLEEGSFDEWLRGEEWDEEQYQEQKREKCQEEIMDQSDSSEDECKWDMKEESESSEDTCEWDGSSKDEYFRYKYKMSEKGDLEEADQPDIVKEIEEGECGCQEEKEINEKYEEYKRFCEDLMLEDEEEIKEEIENECPPVDEEEIKEEIKGEIKENIQENIQENVEKEECPRFEEKYKEPQKEPDKVKYPKSPTEDKKPVPLKPDKKQRYYEQYLKMRSKKPSRSKYYQKGECKRDAEKEVAPELTPSKKMG